MGTPFEHLNDESLMKLYQNGEVQAFNEIYRRHKGRVYTYIYRRIRNTHQVNDLFQAAFLKFHKTKDLYNPKYPLMSWLYTITRSELIDSIRKNKTTEVVLDDISSEHIQGETIEFDLSQESSLTQPEVQAIKLRYIDEKDYEEIASHLKCSQSNSRKLVSRALQKLREKYVGGSNE